MRTKKNDKTNKVNEPGHCAINTDAEKQKALDSIPENENQSNNLPLVWLLFSFILGKKTRDTVFLPLFNEFLKDYLLARRFKTKWAKRWLNLCFVCRTTAMIFGCFRVMIGAKVMSSLGAVFSSSVKALINKFLSLN